MHTMRSKLRGEAEHRAILSPDLPGTVTATAPGDVDLDGYDMVALAMAEPQYASAEIPGLMARIAAAGLPAIFCVGLPAGARVQTGHAPTQRRVDLLAIEQNAWVLAARDPRCVVVDSRTELDWARGKRRISVWAPSKMILDATDKPEGIDARDLALWLADHMEASQVVMVGTDAPGALPLDAKALV